MLLNLSVQNNTLAAYHSTLTESKPAARLTADKAAASGALTVDNVYGFLIGQYVLLGNWGDPTAEVIRIHASTPPSGTTITLAASTAFDHYTDTPVTVLDYNQVEFSRATTAAGGKSVLATYDLSPDQLFTAYIDLTNTTGYAFFRFKNSASGAYSSYCDATSYSGNGETSFERIAMEACSMAGVKYGSQYATEQQLISDANDALDRIQEKQDWVFELVRSDASISTVSNENEYSLSDLTYEPKYQGTQQGILSVRFGTSPLDPIQPDEMDAHYEGTAKSTLASDINAADTSITLTDSNDFSELGTVYVPGTSAARYSANDQTTGVLSGFSASAFTGTVSAGTNVFQGITPGLPKRYSIFANAITLDAPVSESYAGRKLKFKYLKRLSRFTSFASTTDVPFYSSIPVFMASKIAGRKQQLDDEQQRLGKFLAYIEDNSGIYKLPTMDESDYYNFSEK